MVLVSLARHHGERGMPHSGWRMDFRRLLTVLILVVMAATLPAEAAKRASRFSAITVDARTGSVLFADSPDAQRYPASLTKMMTLYITFQELKAGRIKLSTPLIVSARAARMAPSKLGLKPGSTITVEQAIKALVVKSANDVAAVVGENLGGSESNFATRMTRTARDLGMSRTTYRNASGLPNLGQITTARDQATLSLRIMRDFPQFYPYFRLQGFNFKGRTIRSHNRLVGRFPGTDGLKTGYIGASGYNLATSTRRGDKRLIGVVMGSNSAGRRNTYMMQMLSQHFTKAKNGKTIAAYAGSSQGAIDPIAMASVATVASEPAAPTVEQAAQVADLAAAAAIDEAAAIEGTEDESSEQDSEELAALAKASDGTPQVVEARLDRKPTKLPFAVKGKTDNVDGVPVSGDIGSESEGGDWNLQIGVFPSKKAAEGQLDNLRRKLKQLGSRPSETILVTAKKRRYYRAKFTGFDRDEALATCKTIEKLGSPCLALAPRT
jgi:D-alanyl-D-alanine carboxypeptidase